MRTAALLVLMLSIFSPTLASPGSLDMRFGVRGLVSTDLSGGSDPRHAMAVAPDGAIVVAGESNQ